MVSEVLFGLYLSPLFAAMAKVESDCGATSANVYQIQDIYLDDLSRIYMRIYPKSIKKDKAASEFAMIDYWKFYAHAWARKNLHKPITYEVLARIHNGGPDGMNKNSTLAYWRKVRKRLMIELARSHLEVKYGLIDTTKCGILKL